MVSTAIFQLLNDAFIKVMAESVLTFLTSFASMLLVVSGIYVKQFPYLALCGEGILYLKSLKGRSQCPRGLRH
jgi:hypothetical protein